MKLKNILSLCDGISGGQMALNKLGIEYDNYFASEIDKYAIKVTQHNFPDTIQLGDIMTLDVSKLPTIDLVISGTPCQSFSMAGKLKGMVTKDNIEITTLDQYLVLKNEGFEFEGQSYLFWEFIRILREVKPKYFLMENVVMKKHWEDVITTALGVEPIIIDSALLTAQNRKRLYWTNIPGITQPEDLGITWGMVREHNVEWGPMYYTDKSIEWLGRHGTRNGKKLKVYEDEEKWHCLTASHKKKYSSQRFFGIDDCPESPATIVGRRLNADGHREDYNKDVDLTQCLEVRGGNKMACLTTVKKDTVVSVLPKGRYPEVFKELEENKHYRYITPIECCRLQTVPETYFWDENGVNIISNSQIYKSLGNGWTIDVIAHIFSFINS